MYEFTSLVANCCKTCPRNGTSSCNMCLSKRAKDLLRNMEDMTHIFSQGGKNSKGMKDIYAQRVPTIMAIIERYGSSGVTCNMIKKELDLPHATVWNILDSLKRSGKIRCNEEGMAKVYFTESVSQEMAEIIAKEYQR